ncbi:diaminopimelate decarboxylase [Candidatus Daviesbacteria bacterium]|nr:diaminopimelate decarboxylase [Candidatus Daviesbacteria bacterium]
MNNKPLPFNKAQIAEIIKDYPTPFHVYDEKAIRENAQKFYQAFSWTPGFKNYFAVKALPNPYILKILKSEGMGVDCSALTELILAEKVGFSGEDIMFTSNDTPYEEFKKAFELGAIINLDDITHIPILEKAAGIPEIICFRYNPGPLREHKGNIIIGSPEQSKYGMTKDQLFKACETMKQKGVKRFGLHTMIASNELNKNAFIETADMLFQLVKEINEKVGIQIEFINMGGGIGIPYKPEQDPVDLNFISEKIKKLYDELMSKAPANAVANNQLTPLKIVFECGRMVTGPYGYLVTTAIHTKDTYKKYIGVDACMANLMRPAMYGAYHHETVLGKEDSPLTETYDVVGSICENNDKFAIDRKLPKIDIGDIIVIHDTGAHGHTMGFNYNGKLRSAELLLKPDGSVEQIRRAETPDDYFATLNF